jgi:nicotinamidase-related amidase
MSHPKILDRSNCALVIIDVQEAFRTVIPEFPNIVPRICTVINGFQMLEAPVLVTEQYPKGLGRTAEEIALSLPDDLKRIEKTAFSACGATAFIKQLDELEVNQVLVCGVETHVCVSQTAHDLLEAGFEVHILTDCVASRFDHDREAGLSKMYASGVEPSSVEMALFELMRDSSHKKFKEIQALIR